MYQTETTSIWDSPSIGTSIDLCLHREEPFTPQLILEDKVVCSVIPLLKKLPSHLPIQFIGTLISDDESQRLTYVIDRLLLTDSNTYQMTSEEFFVPIFYDSNKSTMRNKSIEEGIKEIELYCHSSSPIEVHRFFHLSGQLSSPHPAAIHLSFDLLMIKNSFTMTPIDSDSISITSTLSWEDRSNNQLHFGYCCLDQMSQDQILLISENDSETCTLPLIGIWISGNVDIQSPFVWAVCLRYCRNASLIQRLRSGMNAEESFLLVWYPSSSSLEKRLLYKVYSTSLLTIDFDLWTSSKLISIPNASFNQHEMDLNTLFPYDFQFRRVYAEPENFSDTKVDHLSIETPIMSSPNTNGSLFGFPRIPPKPSTHQSPSWDLPGTTPINTPRQTPRSAKTPPPPPPEHQWKEELLGRMKSYESHIQSLTALVSQLFTSQHSGPSTPTGEYSHHDAAVQSESPSLSMRSVHRAPIHQDHSRLSKAEYYQPMPSPVVRQKETMIDYSSLRRSSLVRSDVIPVDILKPIFRFIDHQQQKQQRKSTSPLIATGDPTDPVNVLQSPQQQHVTSTTTTGISFISNGVQMQFINQQSSTTTLFPPSTESLPISPPRSENSLSVEVHGLEMKYLEDDQLAAAIECDRQSQTPPVADKSLSFGTREYLQRYGLFTDTNSG